MPTPVCQRGEVVGLEPQAARSRPAPSRPSARRCGSSTSGSSGIGPGQDLGIGGEQVAERQSPRRLGTGAPRGPGLPGAGAVAVVRPCRRRAPRAAPGRAGRSARGRGRGAPVRARPAGAWPRGATAGPSTSTARSPWVGAAAGSWASMARSFYPQQEMERMFHASEEAGVAEAELSRSEEAGKYRAGMAQPSPDSVTPPAPVASFASDNSSGAHPDVVDALVAANRGPRAGLRRRRLDRPGDRLVPPAVRRADRGGVHLGWHRGQRRRPAVPAGPVRRGHLSRDARTSTSTSAVRPSGSPAPSSSTSRPRTASWCPSRCSISSTCSATCTTCSRRWSRSRSPPNRARCTRSTRSPPSPMSSTPTGCACTSTAPASPTRRRRSAATCAASRSTPASTS